MILNFLILPAMKLNVKAEMNEAMLKMRSSFTAELRENVEEYKIFAGSTYIMRSHTVWFKNKTTSGK